MSKIKKKGSTSIEMVDEKPSKKTLWLMLVSVFLVSFSLLALEITFVRITSLALSYHYVFLVVSLALLGLGAGGIYIHYFRKGKPKDHGAFGFLALFASLFAISIPLSLFLISTGSFINNLALYGLVLITPFFIVGVLLAEVFRIFPSISAKIYGADLTGAAAGALAAVLILNNLGGINGPLFLALIIGIAAMLFAAMAWKKNIRKTVIAVISFSAMAILLGTNITGAYFPEVSVGQNPKKEIFYAVDESYNQGKIIESRWSAFGRTDLVQSQNDPERMVIYVDGTAGTPMYKFNGDFDNPDPEVNNLKTDFPGYFPFPLLKEEERNTALIIGPGGGRDVLLALMGGVEEITAVEVNGDLVDIVQEYAWYNGGIYSDLDNVNVVVDEGRNYLKSQKDRYDIIMLSLPVTKTSRSPEGYALTENFLFTTDSIGDYLDHLTDEGRLIIVGHNWVETLRLLSITLDNLNQRGIDTQTAMNQVYVAGSHMFPVFVLKKTPFETEEVLAAHETLHESGYDVATSYMPGIDQDNAAFHLQEGRYDKCGMLDPVYVGISNGYISNKDAESMLKAYGVDISPVSDDNPFFYKFESKMPHSLSVILWISAAIVLILMLTPSLFWMRNKGNGRFNINPFWFSALFFVLGAGFMLAEISLIQKLSLFLGQPVLSIAVLLSSLLAGAGLGSIISSSLTADKLAKTVSLVSVIIVVLFVIYSILIPIIFNNLLGTSIAVRLLVAFALLFPLGFCMGFPFPSGLRLLKKAGYEKHIPWMWGINGISSVLGSTMAIVIAISFGFTAALMVAAVCYFLVLIIFAVVQYKVALVF